MMLTANQVRADLGMPPLRGGFKVGDRVRTSGYSFDPSEGTVTGVFDGGDIIRVDVPNAAKVHPTSQTEWNYIPEELTPVAPQQGDAQQPAPQPSIGATVARLREAAGLHPFMVGDVVDFVMAPKSIWDGSVVIQLHDGGDVSAMNGYGLEGKFKQSWLSLIQPAPTTTTPANDNARFVVGQWVRGIGDNPGQVVEYDADEPDAPYCILELDDSSYWTAERELEPWRPRVGEHVVITTDEFGERGEVAKVEHVFGSGDVSVALCRDEEETTTYSVADLEPSLPPAPATQGQEYKVGDTVWYEDQPAVVAATGVTPLVALRIMRNGEPVSRIVFTRDLTPYTPDANKGAA